MFAVPAGRTAIVRRISVHNATGAAHTVTIGVRRGSAIFRIARAAPLADQDTLLPVSDDLVLNPGDELVVSPATAGGPHALHVHASGSLLLGEPE